MSRQLTESQRFVLSELLYRKVSKTEIARRLRLHGSTVHRELKRNTSPIGYIPEEAQWRAETRLMLHGRKSKMAVPQTRRYVCQRLEDRWSPDQIAGRARQEFPCEPERQISRQTIYNWIQRCGPDECRPWRACLRFGRPRRRRRENAGRLPGAVSIEGRPPIVEGRRRFGDWEGDTIVGRGRRGGLVSLVERKSGYTLLARVDDLRAGTVRKASERTLESLPAHLRHTQRQGVRRTSGVGDGDRDAHLLCQAVLCLASAGPTKTPTAWSGNTCRKEVTSELKATVRWPLLNPH